MIIDTHCHYNLPPLSDEWETHWQTAQGHTVKGSLVVGTSATTSQLAINIANKEKNLFASIGIHPNECARHSVEELDLQIEQLKKLQSPKLLAIGECGLDYFRLPDDETEAEQIKKLQKQMLRAQLELAKTTQTPIIIHLRDKGETAYWDFLKLFKETIVSPIPFILHCVSGPLDFVAECVTLGAYIGVAGNVTYNNSDHIRSIVSTTPKDRILLETDAPFLPPLPHRGKTCEPWMIQLTEEYLQQFLSLETTQLIDNTVRLFPDFKRVL